MADSDGPESAGKAAEAAILEAGPFVVEHAGARVEGDVEEAGPVGIRLKRLKVSPEAHESVDLHQRASDLEATLRPGGERLRAVEVDPVLGGGTLRSRSEDMRRGRYFQIDLSRSGDAEVRRFRVVPGSGEREIDGFDLTRGQLEDLVDRLAYPPTAED
ncbi:MAG TPA: hypothetical protein DFR83_15680 [Deltaproteobacteria bacterium]|nr:hypothetical protein [Deltaproteobacteria bacterium]